MLRSSVKLIALLVSITPILLVSAAVQKKAQQKSTPRQAPTKRDVRLLPPRVSNIPELVIQSGHSDTIRDVLFSPDGRLLASGGSDKTVRLWETASGRMLRVFGFHRDNVTSIAFSPDGRIIASASLDKNVVTCDVRTGRLIHTLSGHSDDVNAVAFSPDGKTIASGSRDETINIWDTESGELLQSIEGTASEILCLAYSPDGKLLAAGSEDGSVRLWRLDNQQLYKKLAGHTGPVRAIAFGEAGATLASGGDDKSVQIWNVETGLQVRTLQGHRAIVTSLVFSGDGKILVSASHDKTIRRWNLSAGYQLETTLTTDLPVLSVAIDGAYVAAANGSSIQLWRTSDSTLAGNFRGGLSPLHGVAFSPDGKTIACAIRNSIRIWDGTFGGLIHSLDEHSSQVNAVAFSSDGKLLASASADKTVKLWDMETQKVIRTLAGHGSNVAAVAFSRDGRYLASGSVDRTVRLWDLQTGNTVRTLTGHFSLVSSVAFSPDGKTVASGGYDNSIRLWDVESGQQVQLLNGHGSEVTGVAFSPDGNTVASCSRDKTIKLWDSRTGKLNQTLQGHESDVFSLAFTPNGKTLASGSYDKTVRLWDISSGKVIRVLEGHSGPVVSVAFSPDGRLIISGSDDASAKIWSVSDGHLLSTVLSMDASGEWLVISPDGLFDGSPNAWKSLLWRFGGSTFDVAPVEAFFNEFYYPGLLVDLLRGRTLQPAQNIAKVDRRQPTVSLSIGDDRLSPGLPVALRRIKLRVRVAEAAADADHPVGSGARDVRLFRNGSLIRVWRGDVLNSAQSVTLEETISVVAGDNHLTAYAFNRDNIKSADEYLSLVGDERLKRNGTAYIVVVGINEYANPAYNLRYAVADAQSFGDSIRQTQTRLGNFSRIQLVTLLDRDATRANLLGAFRKLSGQPVEGTQPLLDALKPAEPEDAVIVYFAGHGFAQKSRFFLIPHDMGYEGPREALDEKGITQLVARGISDRDLEEAFEHIDAGDLLMVIDACNSGQVLESEEKRRGPMNSKGLAQLAYEKGIYILTASQGYQAALEAAELGHGFLTYALVEEGLKKRAADIEPADGTVLLREWLDYAVERVPEMQSAALQGTRGLKIVFVPGEENVADPKKRNVQRPRVFYRRELETQPLVIEKASGRRP